MSATLRRRDLLRAAAGLPAGLAAAPVSRPNLLFVFADQMRQMSMGCAGCAEVQTRHFDRFAAERGAMLTDAVSTLPVCAPYRAAMLTGRYPLSNTVIVNNARLPDEMPSLGKVLRENGYRTGYIGKWHLSGEPANRGFVPPGPMRHGFDYWAAHNCSHAYRRAVYYRDDPNPVPVEGWEPDVQTGLAIDFIRSAPRNQPFAMVMSWGPPHTPFEAPEEFLARYRKPLKLRPNVGITSDSLLRIDDSRFRKRAANPQEVLEEITLRYYAAISNLDHNFGRLLGCLDELGIAEDTVVVFTSDHGDMLGSHGQFHKGQPWEESVRVPFLIAYPREIRGGTRSDVLLGTPDILPTLLGLMGIRKPGGIQGEDLSPVLRGRSMRGPRSALLTIPCALTTWGGRWNRLADGGYGFPPGFMRPYRAVRTRTHTYARDRKGSWMLYDNVKDPYQRNNLIETRGPGAIPSECQKELADWLDRTRDSFGSDEDYQRWIDLRTGIVREPQRLVRG
ncbi:MAG: sulfatase [Bryobacteraceae bacterium]|nr:sulfatase [Bryobacterales bacterium]NUN03958.1 sulfatase [Bryobacteraceae bacterium]